MAQRNLDYARMAKLGFLLGIALFVVGTGGEFVGHAAYSSLPGWEETLLTDSVVAGIFVGFVSVFGFGIVMPLVE